MQIELLEGRVLFHGQSGIFLDPIIVKSLRKNDETGPDIVIENAVAEAASAASPVQAGNVLQGPNFDDNQTINGYHTVPPDPTGAVGPNHLVSAVNCIVQWSKKDGTGKVTKPLGDFFTSLNASNNDVFDPRVIYDARSGKFIVVALEQNDTNKTSRIDVAISKTSDPNGGWNTIAINSAITLKGKAYWTDFPNVASDGSAVYVTGNLFGFRGGYGGSRLWIINQSTLSSKIYDPGATTGLGTNAFSMAPAQVYGSASGTFLVSTGFTDKKGNDFLSVIKVSSPLTTATFSNTYVTLGNITSGTVPAATQLGGAKTIDAGDTRAANAVWRDGVLWTASTISPTSGADSGQATVHWYKVNAPFSGTISLASQGNVGAEDLGTGTATYYPAVAVDKNGSLGIGFAASSSSLYVGSYYAVRSSAGALSATGVIAAGQDYYVRTLSGTDNRWGDYSAIGVDPSDDLTFWVFGEYASTRGTLLGTSNEDGRWATAWGNFLA